MNDALVVSKLNSREQFLGHTNCFGNLEWTTCNELGKLEAIDVFHHQVGVGVLHTSGVGFARFTSVQHLDDVGVIHRGGRLRFLLESLAELLVRRELFIQDLDGNLATEHRIMRHIHVSHPTTTDEFVELIAPSDDVVTQWH